MASPTHLPTRVCLKRIEMALRQLTEHHRYHDRKYMRQGTCHLEKDDNERHLGLSGRSESKDQLLGLTGHSRNSSKHSSSPNDRIKPRADTFQGWVRWASREEPQSGPCMVDCLSVCFVRVRLLVNTKSSTDTNNPTAQPKDAPIAILGRKIPAGT